MSEIAAINERLVRCKHCGEFDTPRGIEHHQCTSPVVGRLRQAVIRAMLREPTVDWTEVREALRGL
jgi:hypothetical protein